MKILKALGAIFITMVTVLIGLYCYLDSDFVEEHRLHEQIELNLGISLSEVPKSIHRENYGWAEEGGDKALLALNKSDCLAVSLTMTAEEAGSEYSEFMDMFKANGYSPKSLKTWRYTNTHGDFTHYALDASNCILYRVHHYE
jgi:hypothetical protein